MESPFSWRIIFFLIFISIHSINCDRDNLLTYTDQFVLHYDGPPEAAKEIASKHGFIYLNQIFDKRYHLRHPSRTKRSIEPSHNFSEISRELNVSFLQHLPVLSRTKRDLISLRSVETLDKYNDPNWSQMWYLNRGNGLDMNVQKVWDQNITGRGVVVSILDDGLEGDHPDLVENYDPQASYDVNNSDDDPTPRYDIIDSNRHGTRCAGEVAAMANNNKCVVGVAYHAKVGGVRMLDGDVTDAVEARSIGFATDHIDIYSASWGPDDDGKTVDGPGELAARAFVDGVTKGRKGLGSIYIWASGNGGREHDNCNCDGYTNSIWTLSVSSATENGQVPWYSEACSSTLATTYSSGSIGEKQIVTTDLHHGCTISHTGTSASAPLAAAITALALEANRNLTWRDMQHIVAMTSKPGNLHAPDWKTNGVGRKVSHSFGYGLMDATALVDLAKVWVSVPEKTLCEIKSNFTDKLIPSKSYVEMSLNVKCTEVLFLEHVQSRINLSSTRRGDIHIYLTSPAGTRSTLLEKRKLDNSHSGFQDWPFMTVHTWGENPNGIWKLEVHNDGRYPQSRAFLKAWTMVLHGTKISPDRRKRETLPNESTFNLEIPVNSSAADTQLNNTISFNSTLKSVNPPLNANGLESTVGENTRTNTVDNSKDIFVSHWTRENDRPKTKVNSMESNSENSGCRVKGFNGCLDCLSNYILFQSNCVTQCPRGHFKESKISLHQSNDQSFICANCYYSCFTCNGPNDFNCTTCYGDSLLNNGRCEKRELREALDSLYMYYHRITGIVFFLFLFTLGLALYVIAERVPNFCKLCCYFRYPKRRATTRFYDGFTPSDEPTSSSSNFLRLKSVTKLHTNYSHLSEEENDR